MRFLLNEGSLNVVTFRCCCLRSFLGMEPTIYFQIYIDAVTASFHVLVNTCFLNFRLVLLIVLSALVHLIYLLIFNNFLVFIFPSINFKQQVIAFSLLDTYSLLIFSVALHYQLNTFKIPKWPSTSTDLSWFRLKMQSTFTFFPSFVLSRAFHIASFKPFISSFQS